MKRFKVKAFISDMGSYTTVAKESHMETKEGNALSDFNSARRHDDLPELTMEQFQEHITSGNVTFTEIP